MCALVAFLGAYPAIQFHPRHIFHLEILSLWLLGFAISSLGRLAARLTDLVSDLEPADTRLRHIRRPLLFAGVLVVVILLPLVMLRAYQQRTATALL